MKLEALKKLSPEMQAVAMEIMALGAILMRCEEKLDSLLNGVQELERENVDYAAGQKLARDARGAGAAPEGSHKPLDCITERDERLADR